MKDRSSFAFFLLKTTKLVLIPVALLDVLFFGISALQHGLFAAWHEIKQLLIPEIGLWLVVAFAMFLDRRVHRGFTAVQDEIEELKERVSRLETHVDN